jgi:catechol 2,3-dioxygenase-like lactoylglutathione lyase family enzyme
VKAKDLKMTHAMIEHVNITVSDSARTAQMLEAIFGWTVRWQGPSLLGGWTRHVGNETDYLALWSPKREDGEPAAQFQHAKGVPLNHVGILVDDLDAVEARVRAHGLMPFGHDDYEPGRRFYFFDWDGIEYELVGYGG